ncbi:MAG: Rne/Rng family ribonuclease [Reyranellaceae bacterium]
MVKRMLVDATHPEETRVVVVNGTKLEEFDFETSTKKQLKGNIYLAKVIRIEPSLQAAFVEYGGNRHGFLAFSEIHPDYYQIPVADREAILAEQERRARQAEENEGQERPRRRGRHDRRGRQRREETAGNEQTVALGEADAIDTMVSPDQAEQPVVEHWDHEAARSGYRPDETAEAPGSEADRAAAAQAEVAPELAVEREEIFEDRETIDPEGDFRESESDWRDDEEPAVKAVAEDREDSVDLDSEPDAVSGDEPEPARGYAAERQDAPVAYAEAFEEKAAGDDDAAAETGEVDGDTTLAPSESQDVTSDALPDGEAAPENGLIAPIAAVETVGGEDLGEEERPRRAPPLRQYKIQEVIKRRQILLVQVVKEERGNKGAALTTYLSLAGRYAVLMPNAGRGGGISRKITNAADRKRMREMLSELEVPQGMGVILRTAGLERSKPEIKRDYDYLIRLWDSIRDLTLKSTAPALIYEEGNLIKRSIRDLYGKDIEDVLIEGEDAYNNARDFMRQLMPSHVKKVQLYRESIPLFHRYQVETQLDAMHSAVVQLKSGAYIVINPTEALVAIDVNSGRATKERNIEETALRTNIEAAEEIARQLRLRDLAGLIVIDFIDMEDQRHQAQVERKLKEAMRSDRARIQIGRISAFGLLELSRQRLRPSLLETSTEICPHCEGSGRIRSTESTVLHVLRAVEEEGIRRRAAEIRIGVPTPVALYLLNQKRSRLAEIEQRYGFRVVVDGDDRLIPPNFTLERSRTRPADAHAMAPALATAAYDEFEAVDEEIVEETETASEAVEQGPAAEGADDAAGNRRRRRRRRRRRGEEDGAGTDQPDAGADGELAAGEATAEPDAASPGEDEEQDETVASPEDGERDEADAAGDDGQNRRRRRGRRGGRRRRHGERGNDEQPEPLATAAENAEEQPAQNDAWQPLAEAREPVAALPAEVEPAIASDSIAAEPPRPTAAEGSAAAATPTEEPESEPEPEAVPAGPPRRGWWQRLTSSGK